MSFYRELAPSSTDVLDIPVVKVPWDRCTRPEDLTPKERLRRAKFNAKHDPRAHWRKFHKEDVGRLKRELRMGPTRMQYRLALHHWSGTQEWFFQCYPYMRGWI